MALLLAGATVAAIVVIIGLSVSNRPVSTDAQPASGIGRVLSADPPRGRTGGVQVGQAAPNFQWRFEPDGTQSLADLRGETVALLEFLATWCPHCQQMAPVIASLYDGYRERSVTVLGVNISPFGMDRRSRASPADMAAFASRFGAAFPLAFDPTVAVGQAYAVRTFPTTMIIDRQGVVRYMHSGEAPKAELEAALTAALGDGNSS